MFKKEGKRRKKGEWLIVAKKRVGSTSKGRCSFSKGRQKYKIEDKSFSKYDKNSEAGDIDNGFMTQEERAEERRGRSIRKAQIV